MNPLTSTFHIFLAVFVYLIVAVGAAVLVKKSGGNLKEMAGRTSTTVLLLGGAANLIILALTLLLVVGLDKKPLSALGLTFTGNDALFALVGAASTVLLAIAFARWRQRDQLPNTAKPPAANAVGTRRLIISSVVLLVVAVQEEFLYRGYITLNLAQLNPIWILIITTVIFVLIHFLTNRVGRYQIVSWTVSGLVLAGAYLVSGSIWVPIILHLATDLTNVLVFHITGQTAVTAVPTLSVKDRAVFRVVYGIAIVALLVSCYQTPMSGANAGSVTITGVEVSGEQIVLRGQSSLPAETCIHTTLRAADQPMPWWPTDKCATTTANQWLLTVPLGQDGIPASLDRTLEYTARAQADVHPTAESEPFAFDMAGPPSQ